MIFGIIPIRFRFRGKLRRLAQIYQCFLDHPAVGLHPTQIARYTGIGFQEVSARLDATPELFVKLPRRPDGITRYRLTSTTAARSREEVERLLIRAIKGSRGGPQILPGLVLHGSSGSGFTPPLTCTTSVP